MNQMFEPNQSQLPLAEYLRPKFVGEIAGQKHILGEGKSLRVAIESGNLPSMILWGPPRCWQDNHCTRNCKFY